MYNASVILFGLIIVLLQCTFVDRISVFFIKPDLVFLYVIFIAFRENHYLAVFNGFIAGLFLGIFSICLAGLNSMSKTLIAFFITGIKSRLYREDMATQVIIIIVFGMLELFILFITANLFSFSFEVMPSINIRTLLGVIYTGVIAPPVFYIFNKIIDLLNRMFNIETSAI